MYHIISKRRTAFTTNEPAAYVAFYQMAISAKILRLLEMFSPRYEYYMVTGISFVGGRQVQSLQT